jgi:pimeloyl-ACP methyl ester carboxylesterase
VIDLPEQKATLRRAQIHGTWIGYEVTGQGPVVVFIAGRGAGFETWRLQTAELNDAFGCVLFDLPGVGVSQDSEGPFTIERFMRDTLALIDHLGVNRAHFVGTSLGAAVVQEIAIRKPDRIASAVLMSAWSSSRRAHAVRLWLQARAATVAAGRLDLYDRYSYLLLGASNLGSDDPRLERFVSPPDRKSPMDTEAELGHYEAAIAHDAHDRLHLIECPTLVLHGTEDVITPPSHNREVADRIPEARLKAIEGAGHLLRLEKPHETASAIREFLSGFTGDVSTIEPAA